MGWKFIEWHNKAWKYVKHEEEDMKAALLLLVLVFVGCGDKASTEPTLPTINVIHLISEL